MLPDRGLVSPLQEAEPVGYFPLVDGAGDVEEEPGDQKDHQEAGHDLCGPLDNLVVAPDRDALIGEVLEYRSHSADFGGVSCRDFRWGRF